MYNSDTELIFPPRVIASLHGLRKAPWDKLVEQVEAADETSPDKLGFVLMMAKLNGCASCNADSFRAMHGCTQCAVQTIRRHHGPDRVLIGLHREARVETEKFIKSQNKK